MRTATPLRPSESLDLGKPKTLKWRLPPPAKTRIPRSPAPTDTGLHPGPTHASGTGTMGTTLPPRHPQTSPGDLRTSLPKGSRPSRARPSGVQGDMGETSLDGVAQCLCLASGATGAAQGPLVAPPVVARRVVPACLRVVRRHDGLGHWGRGGGSHARAGGGRGRCHRRPGRDDRETPAEQGREGHSRRAGPAPGPSCPRSRWGRTGPFSIFGAKRRGYFEPRGVAEPPHPSRRPTCPDRSPLLLPACRGGRGEKEPAEIPR